MIVKRRLDGRRLAMIAVATFWFALLLGPWLYYGTWDGTLVVLSRFARAWALLASVGVVLWLLAGRQTD